MPINPIRVNPIDAPPPPRPMPAVDFSGISSLGDSIGRYREQQELSQIMASAVDPRTGALDMNKAASALAVTGRDPTKYLTLLTAQQGQERAAAAQRALETHYNVTAAETARANAARERQEQQRIDQPQQQFVPPTLMTPGYILQMPKATGQPPIYHPVQPPPAATVGPQTQGPLPPDVGPTAAVNPEEGPPYRVAGPVTAAPSTPASVPAQQPAAVPARNDAFLARLPTDAARTIVKGVAEYEIDPATLQGRDREEVIAAAKLYRPDYSMSEYQKRGSPPSGEIAARIGLAKAFLERTPQIKERIQADELHSVQGKLLATVGKGGPGELRRAIDEGSEALLRGLTGAGMSTSEAGNYARRYQYSLVDGKEDGLRKLNELENALRYVSTEVGKGRGGEDFLKGFQSKFGETVVEVPKVKNDQEANTLIGQARGALQRDPSKRDVILQRLRDRGVRNPELMLGQ